MTFLRNQLHVFDLTAILGGAVIGKKAAKLVTKTFKKICNLLYIHQCKFANWL